ncbi:MAG: PAS domain S-box protein [Calditrichaeota bacterium]|nr:MAG: PAS domain S-box protein [Calditrichota bacterium]
MDELYDLQQILNSSKIGILDWDLSEDIIIISDILCQLLDYPVSENSKVELPASQLIPSSEIIELKKYILSHNNSDKTEFSYQHTLLQKNGFQVWVLNNGTVSFDAKNVPKRLVSTIVNITDIKVSELSLKESESRYRALFESSNDGLLFLDKDLQTIKFANNAFSELVGYEVEELLDKNICDFTYPGFEKNLNDLLESEDSILSDIPFRRSDHEYIFVEVNCISTHIDTEEYYICLIRDRTARKIYENSILHSKVKYHAYFANAPYGIIVFDTSGKIYEVNQSTCDTVGLSEKKLIHNNIKNFIHPNDLNKFTKLITKHNASGKIESIQNWVVDNDKEIIISLSGVIINENRIIAFINEITDKVNTENLLIESELRYRNLMAQSSLAIMVMDLDGKIVDVNNSFLSLWNISEQILPDILDKFNIFTDEQLKKFDLIKDIKRAFLGETVKLPPIQYDAPQTLNELQIFRKEGRIRWIQSRLYPIRNNRGVITNVVLLAEDISDVKNTELALKQSEDQMRLIIETSPIGISVFDKNGQCIIANPSLPRIIGGTEEDVLKQNYNQIQSWKSSGLLRKAKEAIKNNRTIRYEVSTESTFGKKVSLDTFLVPLSDEKLVFMAADISVRKRNELIQKVIFNISESVNTTNNLSELLEQIRVSLGLLIDTSNIFIALYDSYTDMYSFPYSKDQDSSIDLKPKPLKKSFTDYVRRTEKPLIADKEMIYQLVANGEADLIGKPAEIWLGVPLRSPGGVIGVLSVQSYDNPDMFSKSDLDILTFASEQIALAIERKQSEEALSESEEKFKMIAEQSFDAIVMINLTGEMNYVSPSMNKLSGYDQIELLGVNVLSIVPDSESNKIKEAFQAQSKGEFINLETKLIKKNGDIAEIEVNAAPILEGGVVVGGCGFLKDVTELNSTLRKLQESEEKFKRITERSFDAIYVVNQDLILEYISPSMERNFGHRSEDVLGTSSLDYIPKEDIESTKIALKKVFQGEKIENDTARIVCTDGTVCDLEINVVPIYKDNEIVGAQGMIRDVTEKNAALNKLKNAEQEYRNLFEFAPISTWREDFSDTKKYIEGLKKKGIKDFRKFFEQNPDEVYKCIAKIKIIDINNETINLHKAKDKEEVLNSFEKVFESISMDVLIEELMFLINGDSKLVVETVTNTFDGEQKNILVNITMDTTVDDWSNAYVSIIDITELKDTEKALREAETEYRNLFELAPISISRQDYSALKKYIDELKEKGIDDFEAYFEDYEDEVIKCISLIKMVDLNYETVNLHKANSKKEVLNSFEKVFEGVSLDFLKRQLLFLINEGTKFEAESVTSTVDGEQLDIIVNISLDKRYEDWSVAYVSVIDITELKNIEKALVESEKRYKHLFEVAQEGIWVFDTDSNTTLVNHSMAKMLGYSIEEMVGKHIHEFMDEDGVKNSNDYLNNIQDNLKMQYGFEFINKQGMKLYTTLETAPIFDTNNIYIGYIASVVNISEIKSVETELLETKLEFDQILARSHAVVYIKDLEHKYLYANSRYEEIFNLTSNQILGKTDHELFDKEYADKFLENDNKVIAGKYDVRIHEVVIEKDNLEHTYISDKFPLYDSEGNMYATCGVSTDITDLMQIQEKEKKLQQQLVLKDRLINAGHLAAAVAHEINNPMTVLHGSLEEIKESKESINNEVIDGMLVVSRRIKEIINNLLVFTRQTEHRKEATDINSIIRSKFLLLGNLLNKSSIEYSLELAKESLKLNIDRAQIEQVFLNIILNAMDAMSQGGELTIKSYKNDGYVYISFKDNGVGIPEKELDSIFLPFFTTKDVGKGTGLGLSISYGIIEEHGGTISVTSQVGKGSIFTVKLPIS